MFSIITDTSANLPTKLAEINGIIVVPFTFNIEGEENRSEDTRAFDGHAYYEAMRNGKRVTTSQIPPQRFIDYIEPELKKGNDIIYIGMSSGISGAFNSAELAIRQLREDYPDRKMRLVDTFGASLGEGMQVFKAVDCRKCGMSVDETAKLLLERRSRVGQIFTVEDLTYLKRGGRLSGSAALIGTLLNIKPILMGNEEGKIVSCGKSRGRKASIEELAKRYDTWVDDDANEFVGIAHADCEEDAKRLAERICKNHKPKEIILVDFEPVTGSHIGPGGLALFFMGKEGVRKS